MRIIETKIYKFDELSNHAKQVALDTNRYCNVEDVEWLKEQMASEGFEDVKISFSGLFCSHSDGASFTCDIDMSKMFLVYAQERVGQLENLSVVLHSDIDRALMEFFPEAADIFERYVDAKVVRCNFFGASVHWNPCRPEIGMIRELPILEGLMDDFEVWLEAHRRWWCDNMISDEAVADSLVANEREFTEDGRSVTC